MFSHYLLIMLVAISFNIIETNGVNSAPLAAPIWAPRIAAASWPPDVSKNSDCLESRLGTCKPSGRQHRHEDAERVDYHSLVYQIMRNSAHANVEADLTVKVHYVATSGSDNGTGSSNSPWRTINKAMSALLKPGDEVVVRSGTYREQIWVTKDGAADSYITIRSEVPGGALLRPPSSDAYSTLNVQADYIKIEGFDVVGGGGHGIDISGAHHVTIRGNTAHGSGGSGITSTKSDWLTIEDNHVYGNSATNGYQTSGISLWQNVDLAPGNAEFRNIIRNNVTHDNVEGPAINWEHTDGNGIIIDGFHDTNYTYGTLIEGNLSYGNGGKGIHVFLSDYVTVRNNTVWHNNIDNANQGTWRGELSNALGSHNTWVNNIAVADPGMNSWNRAINNVTTNGYVNQDVKWHNNITFSGTPGQASVLSDYGLPSAANGNLLGVDPKFVNAAGGNFHLKLGSPAINAGTLAFGFETTDMDNQNRVNGTVDIGADESIGTSSINAAPTNISLAGAGGDETAAPGPIVGQLTATHLVD
jgi:parallel beta-helix repeat protein